MIDKPKNHRNIQICMENLFSTDLVKTIIQGWYNKFTQLPHKLIFISTYSNCSPNVHVNFKKDKNLFYLKDDAINCFLFLGLHCVYIWHATVGTGDWYCDSKIIDIYACHCMTLAVLKVCSGMIETCLCIKDLGIQKLGCIELSELKLWSNYQNICNFFGILHF